MPAKTPIDNRSRTSSIPSFPSVDGDSQSANGGNRAQQVSGSPNDALPSPVNGQGAPRQAAPNVRLQRHAVRTLRKREVKQTVAKGMVGANAAVAVGSAVTLGMVMGGVLKGAALGGVVGAFGGGIGAIPGAVIGGIVGGLAAALGGTAIGAGIGWAVGKLRARKINSQSLQQKYAPDTKRFRKLASKAGVDPQSLTDVSRANIAENFKTILDNRINRGVSVDKQFMESVLGNLIKLHGESRLSPEQKVAVSAGLDRIVTEAAKDNVHLNASVIARSIEFLTAVNTNPSLGTQEKQALASDFATGLADAQANGRVADSDFATKLAAGLNTIARQPGLTAAGRKGAISGLRRFLLAQHKMGREPGKQEMTAALQHLVRIEKDLVNLDRTELSGDRFTAEDKQAFRDRYRGEMQGRLILGQPINEQVRRAACDRSRRGLGLRIPETDRGVDQVRNRAQDQMDRFAATLMDNNATPEQIATGLQKALAASRLHTASRVPRGLNADGTPNLRSNGQRRKSNEVTAYEYMGDFSATFQRSLQRSGMSPDQAKLAYQQLVGQNGKLRAMYFAAAATGQDPRVGVDEDVNRGESAMSEHGLRTLIQSLGRYAYQGDQDGLQKVDRDMSQIDSAVNNHYNPERKLRTYLDFRVPHNIQSRDARAAYRNRVQHELRNTPEYQQISKFRFDANNDAFTPRSLQDAGLSDVTLVNASRDAYLGTIGKMQSDIDSVETAVDERNRRVTQQEAARRSQPDPSIPGFGKPLPMIELPDGHDPVPDNNSASSE